MEAQRLRDLGTNVEEKFLSGSAFDELVTRQPNPERDSLLSARLDTASPRRLLVGSVAERQLRFRLFQPWLCARAGGCFLDSGEHPLKVLVGYDFSAASDAALGWVNQLRKSVSPKSPYSTATGPRMKRAGWDMKDHCR